jgi:hypothetical protein
MHCPACHHPLDAVSDLGMGVRRAPRVDDRTLCGYCGAALRFATLTSLVPLTEAEIAALSLPERVEMRTMQRAVAAMIAQRRATAN